jgi:hypothetical protein
VIDLRFAEFLRKSLKFIGSRNPNFEAAKIIRQFIGAQIL